MRNPLTAASLGLHIGLLLCLSGCGTDAAPEQVDEQCVEDATPLPVPEKSVEVPMATKADVADLQSQLDNAIYNWKEAENFRSVTEGNMGKMANRIKALESADHSCPLPEVGKSDIESLQKQIDALKPKSKPKTAAKPVSWRDMADAEITRYVVFVCRQTRCMPCDTFEINALGDKFVAGLTSRDAVYVVLNVDHDADAQSHFEVNRTPKIVVYDKTQGLWHGMLADGNDSPGQALWRIDQCIAALNAPDEDAAPPRKRLRNLLP